MIRPCLRLVAACLLITSAVVSGCGVNPATSAATPPALPPTAPAASAATPLSATAAPAAQPAAAAASTSAPPATARPTEQPIAPEQNPVGDIPDNQAFVTYTAPAGYALDVPEGWARAAQANNVTFISKFNGLRVTLAPLATAPTAATATQTIIPAFIAAGRAVTVSAVQDVTLPAGAAVKIVSSANSAPDDVTNKQVRLEQNTYLFFKNGELATLTMEAPQGADNVDQWKRIAESFRWQ